MPISEEGLNLPEETLSGYRECNAFICEKVRTFRRLVKHLDHPRIIDDMDLEEMDKYQPGDSIPVLSSLFKKHDVVGVVSEAGCPAVADPGYRYVEWCHGNNVVVKPFTGPNSLMLALMASGFYGQSFAFNGYLSSKKPNLAQDLKKLEAMSKSNRRAEIFIEAPYRNNQIMEVALKSLQPTTMLHVSVDLHSKTEYTMTKSIDDWGKAQLQNLHKRLAVFIIKAK
jgi:16S rRNA (cytidine1402-2'-O)-methyltransferase